MSFTVDRKDCFWNRSDVQFSFLWLVVLPKAGLNTDFL